MLRRLIGIVQIVGWIALMPVSGRAEGVPLSERQESVLSGILTDRAALRWTDLETHQLISLRARVDAYMAACRKDHRVGGLIVSLRSSDTNRVTPSRYEEIADSASWTGFYLASLAFRFAVTQEPEILADIRETLDGVDRLLTSGGPSGYLARFAGRADDRLYQAAYGDFGGMDPARPGMGRLAFHGTNSPTPMVWLGDTDRDAYAAMNFGLATCHEMLVRELTLRERIAKQVKSMIQRLEKDGWQIRDGQGHVTFVTPLLKASLMRTAATVNPKEFAPIYEVLLRDPQEVVSLSSIGTTRYGAYRPATFAFANWVVLARLERNETRKVVFQDRCTQLWREGMSHLNPWYAAAMTASIRTATTDPAARATLQGVLIQFPPPPLMGHTVDHSQRDDLIFLEANGHRWSKIALPFSFRAPAAFQWAESPFSLTGGKPGTIFHPGIDLFLPYWIAREGDLIPAEDDVRKLDSSPKNRSTNQPAGKASK